MSQHVRKTKNAFAKKKMNLFPSEEKMNWMIVQPKPPQRIAAIRNIDQIPPMAVEKYHQLLVEKLVTHRREIVEPLGRKSQAKEKRRLPKVVNQSSLQAQRNQANPPHQRQWLKVLHQAKLL